MNRNLGVALSLAVFFVLAAFLLFGGGRSAGIEGTGYRAGIVAVTDVQYRVAYPVGHTFLCTDDDAGIARDWHSTNRWVKNQLSYDTYTVDGRVYQALRFVTNDSTLPARHVRFRKEIVDVGTGPRLEGHDYQKTLINGRPATIQRELLFVEFNGTLEPQARPLPACGTPRS